MPKRNIKVAILILFSLLWAACWKQNGGEETILPTSVSASIPADQSIQVFRIDDYFQLEYPSEFHVLQVDEEDEYLDIYFLNYQGLSSFIEIRSYVYDSISASSDFTQNINDQFQQYLNGQIEETNFVPDSWTSTVVNVCGIPVTFYEYQVYIDSTRQTAGTKISNYFSVDEHVFSIELQLHPDEENEYEELRQDYWDIINSIECPVIQN